MSDLRNRLERLGDRVRVAPDAFERLERARRRRERTRRITAGSVALLVAIAGSVAAYTAFRTGDGGRPAAGGSQTGFFALWPEQTSDGLAAAQAAVDAGDPDLAWRSDPKEVARRFALDVLQWPAVTVSLTPNSVIPGGLTNELLLDLTVPPGSRCDQAIADASCPTTSVTLKMARLGPPDGLWSVERVKSTDLTPPFKAGEEVASGTSVVIPAFLPEGTEVSMGVSYLTACDVGAFDQNVQVTQGLLRFTVPGVPDGCVGYVYAMTPQTPAGAVSVGNFLFSDASTVPAIGYLVDEIAAVPVLFTDTSAEPSNVAEFTCDSTGTIAPSSLAVDAEPDGVRVAVTNLADEPIAFTASGSDDSLMYVVGGQGEVEPGERKEIVLGLPPGDAHVSCRLASAGAIDTSPMGDVRVEDPAGSYIPIGMDCPMSSQSTKDATSFDGDPVDVARQHLSGLEYDDAVERAGYPLSDKPIVRVRRNGDVVAMGTFRDDGQGGWLIETLVTCADVPIAWTNDIAGVSGPMGPTSQTTTWDQLCSSARADGANTAHNGSDLTVEGRDIAFDTRCLIAPAGQPITIRLRNEDQAIQRNLSIYPMTAYLQELLVTGALPSDDIGRPVFDAAFVVGVGETTYRVGPLEPGEYYFQDDIHPSANGVLIVE